MCSLAQVSEPALEQERRRSQAMERQRTRQARWHSVFGQPETAPAEVMGWWAAEGGVQRPANSLESFIVRADQKPKWSGAVPVHPDSFARTLWDILLMASILLTILIDPIRCAPVCSHLPVVQCFPASFCRGQARRCSAPAGTGAAGDGLVPLWCPVSLPCR